MCKKENLSGINYRIRKNASIGESEAEFDSLFLTTCFTETGDLETLIDCSSPHRIIVGRTGTGKSALIYKINQEEENVIEIKPEALSLNYLANSDIIPLLEKAGIKLDIFYTLLWRHVFTVELLKKKFKLTNEDNTKNWANSLLSILKAKDKAKERALSYLRDWGNKFWQETEYRVKEITQKLEENINTDIGVTSEDLKLVLQSGSKASEEKKYEVKHKVQKVINSIQIKELSDVLTFLADEVFTDPQKKYYILIDKLDENWVEDNLRLRLIRALIETIKTFRCVPNVKIIIALRLDLIQRVFEKTKDGSFQEDKYQSLFLYLRWSKSNLVELLDKRIGQLVSEQYTSKSIKHKDLFPNLINKTEFIDYLLTRTFYRPRDIITFVNECLKLSEGKGYVHVEAIRKAEIEYSAQRIDSLTFEWFNHYPDLEKYLTLIERMNSKFKLNTITKEKIDSFALTYAVEEGPHSSDPVMRAAYAYLDGGISQHKFIITLTIALYNIGIFGIKPDSFTGILWSYLDTRPPTEGQIKPTSSVFVHPMVWSRLGIITDN
ncbi:P-loop ATPase, Sll1717 family [Nitrosomonas sp. Nm58]|uniref:P-loop ATPase, Sll1717 family n=1 Tax=Nitrosomonas sp. Nm58 TaxID=200126 RepID=UPI000B831B3E|nr:DNA repair protein [Nitrosomonas sp. Nm58]